MSLTLILMTVIGVAGICLLVYGLAYLAGRGHSDGKAHAVRRSVRKLLDERRNNRASKKE